MKNKILKVLATIGALAIAVCAMTLNPLIVKAGTGPVIITEPADVSVNYPEGATFSVAVENPEEVASYQWVLIDSVGQEFFLDGTSASTDTLIVPSTERNANLCYVYCIITDKDGNEVLSSEAAFDIANPSEKMPLLYVESYALHPGDSIDLAAVTPALGTGTVTFGEDADSVILDNVEFDNTEVIFDHTVSPSIFLMYRNYENQLDQITLELKGENSVVNHFYQEASNGSGIPVDFFSLDSEKVPELVIEGEGTLSIQGGTYLIRNNGPVTVRSDLELLQMNGHFCDGIHSEAPWIPEEAVYLDSTITIDEDVKVEADVNGTAFFSPTAVFINPGAEVNIHSSAPLVGAGDSSKRVIYAGSVIIDNASVDISMELDPDRFDPPYSASGMFVGIAVEDSGIIEIKESTLDISITAGDTGTIGYAFNDAAIMSGNDSNVVITDSEVNIDIDSTDMLDVDSMRIGGLLTVTDSILTSSAKASGMVHGIYTRDGIVIEDSIVDSEVSASPAGDIYDVEASAHAILTNGYIDISLSDEEHYVRGISDAGLAIGVDYEKSQEPVGFDPDYEPQFITLGEDNTVVTPESFVINRTSRPSGARHLYTETIYNDNDHSVPAAEVIVAFEKEEPSSEETTEETSSEETSEVPSTTGGPIPPTGDSSFILLFGLAAILAFFGMLIAVSRLRRNK